MTLINGEVFPANTKIVGELPPASTWLNYRGDVRSMVGQIVGPNLLGEYLTVVSCEYDEAADIKSRVGLAFGVYLQARLLPDLPTESGSAK